VHGRQGFSVQNWASATGTGNRLEEAIESASDAIREELGPARPDLVVAFVSSHFADEFDRVPAAVRNGVGAGLLLGCSAGGVIGGGSEVEARPAVSLTAAALPDVDVVPFHLEAAGLPAADAPAASWENLLGVRAEERPNFLLLPEPFSFEPDRLLAGLDETYRGGKKIGGLASGGTSAGANALFLGGSVYRAGAVGLALSGNIEVDTVVAQGCRPIGQPMFVTRSSDNILIELDGRTPMDVLRDLYASLDSQDQTRFRQSLFLGIVMEARRDTYGQGDFLVRNIVGVDEDAGVLAVAARLEPGQVVQFHLRDKRTSSEDIEQLLSGYARSSTHARPEGSLLFSCLGRGENLYGRADHDSDAFRRHLGEVPLGGFFCNGEIGEVGGRTFLHGYTSAFGLFRSRPRA
jgi:small ligand-binding sensory domain FIST